jgi:hypothetical protein
MSTTQQIFESKANPSMSSNLTAERRALKPLGEWRGGHHFGRSWRRRGMNRGVGARRGTFIGPSKRRTVEPC